MFTLTLQIYLIYFLNLIKKKVFDLNNQEHQINLI
jgi:hypothetical protein